MMRSRVGRWALMAVAVPVAAAGARKLSRRLESRRGSNRVSRLLRQGADMLRPQRQRRRFGW